MRLLFVLSIFILISGCANSINEQALLAKAECCSQLTQVDFVEADSNNEIEFSISEDSPAFKFPQGASYYHAMKLSGDNKQFLIRSFFSRSDLKRIASPVLVELDSDLKVLAHKEPLLDFSELPKYEEPHMLGLIQLNEKTKYLIIYPSNNNAKNQVAKIRPSDSSHVSGVELVYYPGVIKAKTLLKIPTGKMELVPLAETPYANFEIVKSH